MPDPIDSAAAWRGEELWQRADVVQQLLPAELSELDAAVQSAGQQVGLLDALDRDGFPLQRLADRLRAVQASLEDGPGVVWLRGLPVERYSQDELELLFWGLATHLGTPVPQTVGGARLFHVRDERLADDHPQARGPSSRKGLSFHTDRCDAIAFLCLQQARAGGENEVVSSAAIFNRMLEERPDLVETLMQPFLYQRHNVDPGNPWRFYEQPIFSFCEGHFAANLMRVLIERAYQSDETPEMTDAQREALDMIERLGADPAPQVRFRQSPGDIVLLNNFVTLHRRTEFEDFPEPERRRHLLRVWLSVPNSRPLDQRLTASYGATEAGAVRGGFRVSR